MQKNCIYSGKVLSLGSEGEGIINCEGTTAFVPFCLTGEEVTFKALKVKGNISYGKAESIDLPSPERVTPPCPVFYKCGGCDLQHMNYSAQLAFKKNVTENALRKLGGIYAPVNDTVPCEKEWRYRNKAALPIGRDANGETAVGFYAHGSHRIVPADDCPIQAKWYAEIPPAVKKYAHVCGYSGYDGQTGTGDLRHIVVREIKGKFIITLVATHKVKVDFLIKELENKFENFTFLLNVNSSSGNVIFSDEWHVCRGEGFFEGEECGIKYRAGANTFLQVNDEMRSKLYSAIIKEASLKNAVAVDLYSGGGMLTAMLCRACGKAYGVEAVEEATRCADMLRDDNCLQGKMFNLCGKVEDRLDEVLKLTAGTDKVVVSDPPRKGMERSVVEKLKTSGARKIILVSCNPATLARDLGVLCGTLRESGGALVKVPPESAESDYEIKSITPFDMFPQTKHVETLVVLSHKKPDGHIGVKVEFGEEEGQISLKEVEKRAEERKPKEKVTYKMIQDYIEKTYGFKVHTAYIAEVKRDLGLPMYDAPNAVEELKRPRSHPSPQMVEAIKETLKHFEII